MIGVCFQAIGNTVSATPVSCICVLVLVFGEFANKFPLQGSDRLTYLRPKQAHHSPEHTSDGLQISQPRTPDLKHLYLASVSASLHASDVQTRDEHTVVSTYCTCEIFFEILAWVVLFILVAISESIVSMPGCVASTGVALTCKGCRWRS